MCVCVACVCVACVCVACVCVRVACVCVCAALPRSYSVSVLLLKRSCLIVFLSRLSLSASPPSFSADESDVCVCVCVLELLHMFRCVCVSVIGGEGLGLKRLQSSCKGHHTGNMLKLCSSSIFDLEWSENCEVCSFKHFYTITYNITSVSSRILRIITHYVSSCATLCQIKYFGSRLFTSG